MRSASTSAVLLFRQPGLRASPRLEVRGGYQNRKSHSSFSCHTDALRHEPLTNIRGYFIRLRILCRRRSAKTGFSSGSSSPIQIIAPSERISTPNAQAKGWIEGGIGLTSA